MYFDPKIKNHSQNVTGLSWLRQIKLRKVPNTFTLSPGLDCFKLVAIGINDTDLNRCDTDFKKSFLHYFLKFRAAIYIDICAKSCTEVSEIVSEIGIEMREWNRESSAKLARLYSRSLAWTWSNWHFQNKGEKSKKHCAWCCQFVFYV